MTAIEYPEKLTRNAIFGAIEKAAKEEHRPHLGASIIGKRCSRAIWYTFRWVFAKKFEGRMLSLFEDGHLEEPRMAEALARIGVKLDRFQPGTDKQWTLTDFGGHFGGSMDGIGSGFPEGPQTTAAWECKTFNTKTFNQLVSDGLRKTKPEHYDQIQVYMGLSGLKRAMYTARCKETSDIESIWVHFDADVYEKLMEKAFQIIKAEAPPEKISKDPTFWTCNMCDYKPVCHAGTPPEINCRTCVMSQPLEVESRIDPHDEKPEGGKWLCRKWKSNIPLGAQRAGCEAHRYIPILLEEHHKHRGWNGDDVVYANKETGVIWQQGTGFGAVRSAEIVAMKQFKLADYVYETKTGLAQQGVHSAKVVGGANEVSV